MLCVFLRTERVYQRSLLEAAACGRAVVTTNVPGCRDAVIPGETGLLVKVKDATSLADAIQFLIEKPKLRKKLGQAGRVWPMQTFAIRKNRRTAHENI